MSLNFYFYFFTSISGESVVGTLFYFYKKKAEVYICKILVALWRFHWLLHFTTKIEWICWVWHQRVYYYNLTQDNLRGITDSIPNRLHGPMKSLNAIKNNYRQIEIKKNNSKHLSTPIKIPFLLFIKRHFFRNIIFLIYYCISNTIKKKHF